MSISFCDDDSQYPAFFGPRDLEIPKDEILDHLDWPPVDLACNGITYIRSRFLFADAPSEKATKPPTILVHVHHQLAYPCTLSGTASHARTLPFRYLRWRLTTQLRFAPLDFPSSSSGFRRLFEHYSIPADFLAERRHNVARSSGTRSFEDGSYGASMPYAYPENHY